MNKHKALRSPHIILGIVVKYNDALLNADTSTVDEHNKVFHEKGRVWFGKFGVPIRLGDLSLCSGRGVELRLILFRTKKIPGPRVFFAPISAAQGRLPPSSLVPAYYRNDRTIYTWFCLSERIRPMKPTEISSWVLAHSELPLLNTVTRSSRTFFWAAQKTHAARVSAFLGSVKRDHATRVHHPPATTAESSLKFPSDDELDTLNESFSEAVI